MIRAYHQEKLLRQEKDRPGTSKELSAWERNHEPKEEESNSDDEWEEAAPGEITLDGLVKDMQDEHQIKFKRQVLDRIMSDDKILVG